MVCHDTTVGFVWAPGLESVDIRAKASACSIASRKCSLATLAWSGGPPRTCQHGLRRRNQMLHAVPMDGVHAGRWYQIGTPNRAISLQRNGMTYACYVCHGSATYSFGLPDRRFTRFHVPQCRTCGLASVVVHDRTDRGLILDCRACEDRWLVAKPSRAEPSSVPKH